MSTVFFTPPTSPSSPSPISTADYHRSMTRSIFTRLDAISQSPRESTPEDDEEQEEMEGARRKSIYRERDQVEIDGSELGFDFQENDGCDETGRRDQHDHEGQEEEDDNDDDEDDEPDFYSLPLIPIGHSNSLISPMPRPLVASYIPTIYSQQEGQYSMPSRGRSGRGRTRYCSLPTGSSGGMESRLKLGTVVEDEEEDEVAVVSKQGGPSTPVRTSSKSAWSTPVTPRSSPPMSTAYSFSTPPRTPDPVRIAPAREKANRPLTSSRSHEYIKMFPITSRPKSLVAVEKMQDEGQVEARQVAPAPEREGVAAYDGLARVSQSDIGGRKEKSASYLDLTPVTADAKPSTPDIADEKTEMTPLVCLIPPEEDGNVSVILHPSEPTRLPRRKSSNDLASLILKNPFSFERLDQPSPSADRGRSHSPKLGGEEDDLTIELGRGLAGVTHVGRPSFFSVGGEDSDSEADEDEDRATMLVGKVDAKEPDMVDTFTPSIMFSQKRTTRRVSLTLSTAREKTPMVHPEATPRLAEEAELSPTSISSSTSTAIVASAIVRPSGPGMWRQSYGADSNDSDEVAAAIRSDASITPDVGITRHDEAIASRTSDRDSEETLLSSHHEHPRAVDAPELTKDLVPDDFKVTLPEPAMPSYRRISCTFDLPPPVFSRRGTLRTVSPSDKADESFTEREPIIIMPRRKEDVIARMRSLRGEQPVHDMTRPEGFQANIGDLERKLVNSAQPTNVNVRRQEENRSIGSSRDVSSSATTKPPRIGLRDVFGGQNNVSNDDRKEGSPIHPKKGNEPDERRAILNAPPQKPSSKRSLPSLRSAANSQTPKSLSHKFSFSSLSRAFRWGRGPNSGHTALDREDVTTIETRDAAKTSRNDPGYQ